MTTTINSENPVDTGESIYRVIDRKWTFTVYKRGELWHIRKECEGEKLSKSLKTNDLALAIVRAKAYLDVRVDNPVEPSESITKRKDRSSVVSERDYGILLNRTRKRAKTKDLPFTLTKDDLVLLMNRAGGRCEVSRIKFSYGKELEWFRAPFAPSIDRKNPAVGYTLDNCRLVCVVVNWAISDWGEGVLRDLAFAVVRSEKQGFTVSHRSP